MDVFVDAVQHGSVHIKNSPGAHQVRLFHGIEDPHTFTLIVHWDDVAAHDAFRATEAFSHWRAAITEHLAAPPHVQHHRQVL